MLDDTAPAARALVRSAVLNIVNVLWKLTVCYFASTAMDEVEGEWREVFSGWLRWSLWCFEGELLLLGFAGASFRQAGSSLPRDSAIFGSS